MWHGVGHCLLEGRRILADMSLPAGVVHLSDEFTLRVSRRYFYVQRTERSRLTERLEEQPFGAWTSTWSVKKVVMISQTCLRQLVGSLVRDCSPRVFHKCSVLYVKKSAKEKCDYYNQENIPFSPTVDHNFTRPSSRRGSTESAPLEHAEPLILAHPPILAPTLFPH